MLELDKKLLDELLCDGVQRIKIYFYKAGCSGKKIDLQTDFTISKDLEKISLYSQDQLEIYVPKTDTPYMKNGKILRRKQADHSGKIIFRYVFISDAIQDRCGCGTSFSFEKRKITLDTSRLQEAKKYFIKK